MKTKIVAKVRVTDATGVLVDRTFGSTRPFADVAREAITEGIGAATRRGPVRVEVVVERMAEGASGG